MAGKPARPLLDETVRRVGGDRPLMVGDRLDTDIEGAHEAGIDSLLVLTGVTGLAGAGGGHAAASGRRTSPRDLGGLLEPHPAPQRATGRLGRLGGLARPGRRRPAARRRATGAATTGGGWSRSAAWAHLDAPGTRPDTDGARAARTRPSGVASGP